MNWIVYLFGSGLVFFVAIACLVVAAGMACCWRGERALIGMSLMAGLGLILAAASAAPLSLWLYGIAFAATLWWLATERLEQFESQRPWTRGAALLVWLAAGAIELPYHLAPSLDTTPAKRLYIFADSVTAGMGDPRERTWPKLLAENTDLEIHDHSRPGETVRSAAALAAETTLGEGVVLLEIGGNDLLSGRSSGQYAAELDELLKAVAGPGRTLVMFEVPLPPFCNAYGAAQRRLAAEYNVRLLPKRWLVEILAADGLTVDGIHLSPAGARGDGAIDGANTHKSGW